MRRLHIPTMRRMINNQRVLRELRKPRASMRADTMTPSVEDSKDKECTDRMSLSMQALLANTNPCAVNNSMM